jgi:hypothetical protein
VQQCTGLFIGYLAGTTPAHGMMGTVEMAFFGEPSITRSE